MKRYEEISKMESFIIDQEANMTWYCQNESTEHPDALMSFQFPHDSNSTLALGFDTPIAQDTSSMYANPVQACFFGGLSSLLHTVASRIYTNGYKVYKITGSISTRLNKRVVMGMENRFIFPEGASIEIKIVSNAPQNLLYKIQAEAESMSPTVRTK
jgi:hypothetical protein